MTDVARDAPSGTEQNDVKEDNILVEHATGRPIFVDFALAKQSDDPEDHYLENSELHAMLAQADPSWPVGQFLNFLKMHAIFIPQEGVCEMRGMSHLPAVPAVI